MPSVIKEHVGALVTNTNQWYWKFYQINRCLSVTFANTVSERKWIARVKSSDFMSILWILIKIVCSIISSVLMCMSSGKEKSCSIFFFLMHLFLFGTERSQEWLSWAKNSVWVDHDSIWAPLLRALIAKWLWWQDTKKINHSEIIHTDIRLYQVTVYLYIVMTLNINATMKQIPVWQYYNQMSLINMQMKQYVNQKPFHL